MAVLETYQTCHGKISTTRLADVLQKLDYKYPYAQSVGFLLQQSGHSAEELIPFKKLTSPFSFYVSYGMHDPAFDSEWRVFYPRGIH
jgi:hypothetical protein